MVFVGIDLGTTNSRVAISTEDGVKGFYQIPSYVAFDGETVLVGEAARDHLRIAPQNVVYQYHRVLGRLNNDKQLVADRWRWPFKVNITQKTRPQYQFKFNDETVFKHPFEILALVIKELVAMAERKEDILVTGCVIAVPAMFDFPERSTVLLAVELAGIPSASVILIRARIKDVSSEN